MQVRVVKRGDEGDGEPEELQIAPPVDGSDTMFDLHDELHGWVDTFSAHAEELVRRQWREARRHEAIWRSERGKGPDGEPLGADEAKMQKHSQDIMAALKESMQELR